MISTQFRAINGELLANCVTVPQELLIIFREYSSMPYGLLDYSKETGLVEVALTKEKKCSMKLGRFLKKLSFPDAEVRDYSSRLRAIVKQMQGASITLATTKEEILRVYQEGPHSCMQYSQAVRVYAGPDTAVAYVEIEGKILARTVVVTNEDIGKQWVRIYGNSDLIVPLLLKEGFVKGSLEGCHLSKEEDSYEIVCPYLDDGMQVTVHDDSLEISKYGEWSGGSQSGYLGMCTCDDCDTPVSEDNICYSEHLDQRLCESCYDECHVYVDGYTYHIEDENIREVDGTYYRTDELIYSEHEGEYFHEDDVQYSDYHEDYYKNEDIVEAYTDPEYAFNVDGDTEICFKEYCTYLDEEGFWIETNKLDAYQQMKQGELDFED